MRPIVRSLAALGMLLATAAILPMGPALAQAPAFNHPLVTKDAERLDAQIKAQPRPARQNAGDLRRTGMKQLAEGKDARAAAKLLVASLAQDAKDAATWAALARAYLAITPDPSSAERYDLPALAAGAAWRAYGLANAAADKAAALATLGEALQQRSLWRPAIEALEASVALANDAAAQFPAVDA